MRRDQEAAILLIAGASCAGKDSIVTRLLQLRPELEKVITTTTRPPRVHERDGVHYYFRSPTDFRAAVEAGEFLEHTELYGHLYGLTRGELERIRRRGRVPLAIMSPDGVRTVSSLVPTVRIYVTAPLDHLERRIRAERPPEQVPIRLRLVRSELLEAGDCYDLIVSNADGRLEEAVAEVLDFYDHIARARLLPNRPSLVPAR